MSNSMEMLLVAGGLTSRLVNVTDVFGKMHGYDAGVRDTEYYLGYLHGFASFAGIDRVSLRRELFELQFGRKAAEALTKAESLRGAKSEPFMTGCEDGQVDGERTALAVRERRTEWPPARLLDAFKSRRI